MNERVKTPLDVMYRKRPRNPMFLAASSVFHTPSYSVARHPGPGSSIGMLEEFPSGLP